LEEDGAMQNEAKRVHSSQLHSHTQTHANHALYSEPVGGAAESPTQPSPASPKPNHTAASASAPVSPAGTESTQEKKLNTRFQHANSFTHYHKHLEHVSKKLTCGPPWFTKNAFSATTGGEKPPKTPPF